MELGKTNTTPQMVFCLQMVSSKEKWEKKNIGSGKLSAGLQTSESAWRLKGTGGLGVSESQVGVEEAPRPRGLLTPLRNSSPILRGLESLMSHIEGFATRGDHVP